MLLVVFTQNILGAQDSNVTDKFWSVFVQGNIEQLQEFYSDKVNLKPGSELLKPQWGLAKKGDRATGKILSKPELMRGYTTLISKLGKGKWSNVFGSIKKDKISSKTIDNSKTILTVLTGPGDDYIEFEFALNASKNKWEVVSEYTDF